MESKKDISVIPKGPYCYTINRIEHTDNGAIIHENICPYWSLDETKERQNNGCCSFLGITDADDGGLLWDQVKECGINDDYDDYDDYED